MACDAVHPKSKGWVGATWSYVTMFLEAQDLAVPGATFHHQAASTRKSPQVRGC